MFRADVVFSRRVEYDDTVMNPLIVTIIIALGIFILGVLVASWLYRQALNKRFDNLRTYLDARFAERECAPRGPLSNL